MPYAAVALFLLMLPAQIYDVTLLVAPGSNTP